MMPLMHAERPANVFEMSTSSQTGRFVHPNDYARNGYLDKLSDRTNPVRFVAGAA